MNNYKNDRNGRRTLAGMRLWEILYPVGIYFVVSNIVMVILGFVWTKADGNTYLIWQIIANLVAVPFLLSFYRDNANGDKEAAAAEEKADVQGLRGVLSCILMAVMCAAAGIVLNDLIGLTPLVKHSATFQEVNQTFYGGTLLVEILALCIITPALEELLYRGIVYARLRSWLGLRNAVILSSLLFGIMHFNLVQFIYAALIGVILAYIVEQGGLRWAIAAHALTNLVSVLRSELPGLSRMQDSTQQILLEACLFLLLGILCWYLTRKMVKK